VVVVVLLRLLLTPNFAPVKGVPPVMYGAWTDGTLIVAPAMFPSTHRAALVGIIDPISLTSTVIAFIQIAD
jgi:hypothetical protein